MTDLADLRTVTRRRPPVTADVVEQPVGPAPAPAHDVPLPRLLALARPTAPQAVELARAVLEAAADPSGAAPAGDGRPGAVRVLVGADGTVALRPPGSLPAGPAPADPAGPLPTVLSDVAAAARPPAPERDPASRALLDGLDRAVTALRTDGVAPAARLLQEVAAGTDRAAVRAELAALVRAIGDRGGPGTSGGPPPSVVRASPARGGPRGRRGTALRRTGAWLLSLVVLAAVTALEVGLLRDKITTDVGVLLDAGRGGSPASTAPPPDGLPVPVPAPAAAGSVAAVDLRAAAPCTPGSPCTVRVLVQLVPAGEPRTVSWSYRVIDRCTGATGTEPGGSVPVPAGADRVTAVGTVAVPAAPGAALVAVTSAPAVAASAPVLAGSCPPGVPAPGDPQDGAR